MLTFDKVSKQFTMKYTQSRTFQDLFINMLNRKSIAVPNPNKPATIKILDNISFEVRPGEVLGLIGPNGAGKSTTLKLAAGVIFPDSGRISIGGRVAGLLELGVGFHTELSGRENIFLYGSIMGLSKKTIDERLDEIIEFSGLAHFIDVPVKDYSSGMFARLGFAVSIHVDAEILLIDEALSVGDAAFRQKSFERILDFKYKGGTILLVSHRMTSIEQLCDRVLLLQNGRITSEGAPGDVIENYLEESVLFPQNGPGGKRQGAQSQLRIKAVRLFDGSGTPCHKFESGASAKLRVWFEASVPLSDVMIKAQIFSTNARRARSDTLAHGTSSAQHALFLEFLPGEVCVEVDYGSLNLMPGFYYFRVGAFPTDEGPQPYASLHGVCPFEIWGSQELGTGVAMLPHRWGKISEKLDQKKVV